MVKQGPPVQVPEGIKVQDVPPALFLQEHKILATTRIDDYEATAAALRANHEQFTRHQATSTRRGVVRYHEASNLVVNKLLRDYLVLLDHGLGEVTQEADAIMTTSAGHQLPAAPQNMPDWAAAGLKNCRGCMR